MRSVWALLSAAMLAGLSGCGGASTIQSPTTLTVFAAASLKAPFTTLADSFGATHPGMNVAFNFAGSADLVSQLQSGAAADVFASADTANMAKAVADGLVAGRPVNFAANTLEIAVPPNNPGHVHGLRDLARPGLKVVVCAPQVPCGAAAATLEAVSGVALRPVSEESSVTDVLNKVASGEADAGLVYVTDIKASAGRVTGVPLAESKRVVNTYPIAALTGSKQPDLAREFVALVTGAEGQRVLADAGFAKPSTA